jgi:hypothetical protein
LNSVKPFHAVVQIMLLKVEANGISIQVTGRHKGCTAAHNWVKNEFPLMCNSSITFLLKAIGNVAG